MYVSATSTRFSAGRSTPAIRATGWPPSLLLTLLVPRIALADHADDATATHHLAVLADLLHRGPDLHRRCSSRRLLVAVDDPPAGQVVRRELHRDLVARKDLDE